jgi:hypothetical protein
MNLPLFEASAIAISAPAAISGVKDSIGPVKPSKTPSFTVSATAGVAKSAAAVASAIDFFILFSHVDIFINRHLLFFLIE